MLLSGYSLAIAKKYFFSSWKWLKISAGEHGINKPQLQKHSKMQLKNTAKKWHFTPPMERKLYEGSGIKFSRP